MSIRPRYSLLTLLVLMALIAGGVKLWYGPHYVVEEAAWLREYDLPEAKVEYTFTRDWRGRKVIHGTYVIRSYENSVLRTVEVRYFRNGEQLVWGAWLYRASLLESSGHLSPFKIIENVSFTAGEKAECRNAVKQEKQAFLQQGILVKVLIMPLVQGFEDLHDLQHEPFRARPTP